LAAVRTRRGVSHRAAAVEQVVLEFALVEVAVRRLQHAAPVRAPVLEVAFVLAERRLRPAVAGERAAHERAFPHAALPVVVAAAALVGPVLEPALVARAVLARVHAAAGGVALAELAFEDLA